MGINKWWKKQNSNGKTEVSTLTTSELTQLANAISQQLATTSTPTAADGGKTVKTTQVAKKKPAKRTRVAMITEEMYDGTKRMLKKGVERKIIAKVIGISKASVDSIATHNSWSAFCEEKERMRIRRFEREGRMPKPKQKTLEEEKKELKQWQFIVGWNTDTQRIQANAVRDLARALGLKVVE